jgi:DNA-binding NtrC family response regulator
MKKRILLIDRETAVHEKLRKKLELQDYDLRCAVDGHDALRTVDFRQTDLLLLDLDVPPAERQAILTRTAEINPNLRVVGLTERTELPAAALGAGLHAVVEKPIDMGGLFRLMEQLLTRAPDARGAFRLVPRKNTNLEDSLRRRPVEPNLCPAAYSGWGINE